MANARNVRIRVLFALLAGELSWPAPAFAIELSDIVGKWNSDSISENIEIRQNGDVFDDRLGQGRIATTIQNAANFVIVYQKAKSSENSCWYYITPLDRRILSFGNRSGPNASSLCMFGRFTRVEPPAPPPPPTTPPPPPITTPPPVKTTPPPPPALFPARSSWNHNRSLMYLTAVGSVVKIFYELPRLGMREEGARPNTLLFDGHLSGNEISGLSRIFDKRCSPSGTSYSVSGHVMPGGRTIVMTGQQAPNGWDASCRVIEYRRDVLEFSRAD